jgi:hypothetical protein
MFADNFALLFALSARSYAPPFPAILVANVFSVRAMTLGEGEKTCLEIPTGNQRVGEGAYG